jgi:hypothetical protein
MFWLVLLVIAGLVYLLVDRLAAPLLIVLALVLLIMLILSFLTWVSNITGVNDFLGDSLKYLSGIHNWDNVVVHSHECLSENGLITFVKFIFYMLLAIAWAVLAGVAFIGMYVGVIVGGLLAIVGALVAIFTLGRVRDLLRQGIGLLALGIICAVAFALLALIVHAITVALSGC